MGSYSSALTRQGGKTRATHCAVFSSQTSDRALSATFKQSRERLAGGRSISGLECVGSKRERRENIATKVIYVKTSSSFT
jgi:hypothetical protein